MAPHIDTTDRTQAGDAAASQRWVSFSKGTAALAHVPKQVLAKRVQEHSTKTTINQEKLHVLEIACGGGHYGQQILRTLPHAHVTLQDQTDVIAALKEEFPTDLKDRATFVSGSAFEVEYQNPTDGFDVIIISHFFHHFKWEENTALLKHLQKVAASKGGTKKNTLWAVHDFMRPDNPSEWHLDPFVVSFDLVMLATTPYGRTYSLEEYRRLLTTSVLEGGKDTNFEHVPNTPAPSSWLFAMS
mgnify:CR=1 FL=1